MSAVFPVADDPRWRQHTASAGQTVFPIPYVFQDRADITVEKIALDGTVSTLVYPDDYAISGAGDPAGGNYTLVNPALAGEQYRSIGTAIGTRTMSIVRSGRYSSSATDGDLDRALIRDLELRRDVDRSLKLPLGPLSGSDLVPAANEFIGWNFDGTGIENKGDPGKLGAGDMLGSNNLAEVLDPAAAFDNLAIDWSNGTAGAPKLSMPDLMRRRYVDVGAYCNLSDLHDAAIGFKAALSAGAGRDVVFTNPTGGRRVYNITSRDDAMFYVASHTRLFMAPGAELNFEALGTAGAARWFIRPEGSFGNSSSLTADISAGQTTFPVSDAVSLGLHSGDLIFVQDDSLWIDGDYSKRGELLTVLSVADDTITTFEGSNDNYTVAENASVTKVNACENVSIEGLTIRGPGRFASGNGDRGIAPYLHRGLKIIDCDVSACSTMNIFIRTGVDWEVKGGRYLKEARGVNPLTDYNICYCDAAQNGIVHQTTVRGGSAGIIQSNSDLVGITRDIRVSRNDVSGIYSNAISMHTECERLTFSDNIISNSLRAINASCPSLRTARNHAHSFNPDTPSGAGTTVGIYMTENQNRFSSHDDIIDGATWSVLLGQSDVQVGAGPIDIEIRGLRTYGAQKSIFINYDDTTNLKKGLRIIDLVTRGNSGTPVEIRGSFSDVLLENFDLQGTGTGACVYSVGGTRVEVNDIRWTSPYTQPVIGGTQVVGLNITPWGGMPQPANVNSAATLSPSFLFNTFKVLGTTNISRVSGSSFMIGRGLITLWFTNTLTVNHNANSGGSDSILLAGSANFSAANGCTLTLIAVEDIGAGNPGWIEVARRTP